MRRSLTTAETVRLWSDSGCTARERTKSITEIEKSGQSSRRQFYLISGGRVGSVAATGRYSVGVSQTDAGRPLAAAAASLVGHSWGGGRHESRVATDVLGMAAAACSVIHWLV